jgi:hypothetical protein
MKKLFVDALTGEVKETEASAEEMEYWRNFQEQQEASKVKDLVAKNALLNKLGITEEEAKLLLS